MTDYIKRENAKRAVWGCSRDTGIDEAPFEYAEGLLEDVPSEDVVPVVRCKDCKHRDPEDKRCDCGHAIQWQLPRDDDWFCADGERKDDD